MKPFNPLFKADWVAPSFIHFQISAAELQPLVPFELDTWQGEAYVSTVAFTQTRLRPHIGGRVGEWLSTPLCHHEFLNLRTYVKLGEERGIFFLSEWIPNRLAVLIGPALYGLPYRLGRLRYDIDSRRGRYVARVNDAQDCFNFTGTFDPHAGFAFARPDTLDHFLVERYLAFTSHDGIHRRFHVAHDPWPLTPLKAESIDGLLIHRFLPPFMSARLVLGHFSPGVVDVSIGHPQRQTSGIGLSTLKDNVQSPC